MVTDLGDESPAVASGEKGRDDDLGGEGYKAAVL